MSNETSPLRRALLGSGAALAAMVALGSLMFVLRSHLGVATVALVLVLPVIVGVVVGGPWGGAAAVVAGFLVYDFVFIPPYYTLSVGDAQNWTALGVYVIVVALLTRVMGLLDNARSREPSSPGRRPAALRTFRADPW